MKRFTSMFLAVCMLALPVSGCSQSSGAEASTSVASTASGDAAEEMITLTYWDGWADAGTEPTAAAVTYALEEWEKENPNIQSWRITLPLPLARIKPRSRQRCLPGKHRMCS